MEWVEEARAAAQAQMTEPIVAVGFLQPAGSWGSLGMSQISGSAGSFAQSKANRKAKGLAKGGGFKPKLAMLAVTADGISVFSATNARGGKVKVGDLLTSWHRDDLTITTQPGRLATGVTIDVASTGDRFELEATMVGGGFNDALLAEISPPS
jgi:hypothetical protein